jgi:Zn-dependent peptidase ImmA (M78 family)
VLPVDLSKIATLVGLSIEYFPFPNEISGLLKKELGVIGINETQHPRRQRFTLAHEIGHYVLGHNIIDNNDLIDDAHTDTSSFTEREANYFASVLLMPEKKVREMTKKKIDLGMLADTFGVSEQAMTIRILELGLIK